MGGLQTTYDYDIFIDRGLTTYAYTSEFDGE